MLDRNEVCTDCNKVCVLEKDKISAFDNDRCSKCEASMFAAMEEDGFKADLMNPINGYAF